VTPAGTPGIVTGTTGTADCVHFVQDGRPQGTLGVPHPPTSAGCTGSTTGVAATEVMAPHVEHGAMVRVAAWTGAEAVVITVAPLGIAVTALTGAAAGEEETGTTTVAGSCDADVTGCQ
jgi:hypothetical protein